MLSWVRNILKFHWSILLIGIKEVSMFFIIQKMQKSFSIWDDILLLREILQESNNNTKVIKRNNKWAFAVGK